MTRHSDPAFVLKMLHAGALGYVLKQSSSSALVQAIRIVASGDQYIDPAINVPNVTRTRLPESSASEARTLTQQEESVLRLVADSWSHQKIAERLSMDLDDVMAVKIAAMRKAGLETRTQLVRYARVRGWPRKTQP